MSEPLRWESDGRDWPNRAASRFVEAAGLVWHVQEMGTGPAILLLHGTGAATHSWRALMPLLAQRYRVIAPDLPGHGFTRGRPRKGLTLPGMAEALAGLLSALDVQPELLVGHSAGAAIALRMVSDSAARAPAVIGLNPALMPFPGAFAPLFQSLAHVLVLNPLVTRLLAWSARREGETARFLSKATGSRIDAAGLQGYATLFGNARHCRGALEMMASWDLAGLQREMPAITAPVLLLHADRDSAVPTSAVEQAARLLPDARMTILTGLGHLAHEERPDLVAEAIAAFAPVNA
jgi:magnesium chelatase accessory protein